MGDPKKIRKKFKKPMHPWQKGRIELEKELTKKYGLKNKQEIWKMASILKKFKDQIKKLTSSDTAQSEKEKKQLMEKLMKLGLVKKGGTVDDVLSLDLENVLDRRLQTVVFKKGLARSMNQARQFIIHKHITVGDRKVTSPSYLVDVAEEPRVSFSATSTLHDPDHPERIHEELSKTKITRKPKTQEEKDEEALKVAPEKAADQEVKELIEKKEAPKASQLHKHDKKEQIKKETRTEKLHTTELHSEKETKKALGAEKEDKQ
jgi:small subunit ribosomal protein S4